MFDSCENTISIIRWMHSLDPTVLPTFDKIQRKFRTLIDWYRNLNTYYSYKSDFCPFILLRLSFSVKIQRKVKLEYTEYISTRAISSPNFRPVIQAFTWARAWKEQSAGFRPFFVAKPVQGVRVCSVWIRGSPVSAGSRWKPLLKRSRRRWKSGIENWFQAGTELGGVARSGVADTGWWGAIRFAAVVGEGWQRQVMVYSYSQSGSGVRWGEIASCRERTPLSFHTIDPPICRAGVSNATIRILSRP